LFALRKWFSSGRGDIIDRPQIFGVSLDELVGRKSPKIETVVKLAKVLNVKIDGLVYCWV